jgi:hypothetical protein
MVLTKSRAGFDLIYFFLSQVYYAKPAPILMSYKLFSYPNL